MSVLALVAYSLVVVSTGPDPDVSTWLKFYGGAVATVASVSIACTVTLESWSSMLLALAGGVALGVVVWSALLMADENLWQSGSNGAAFRVLGGAAMGLVAALCSWVAFAFVHRSRLGPPTCSKVRFPNP